MPRVRATLRAVWLSGKPAGIVGANTEAGLTDRASPRQGRHSNRRTHRRANAWKSLGSLYLGTLVSSRNFCSTASRCGNGGTASRTSTSPAYTARSIPIAIAWRARADRCSATFGSPRTGYAPCWGPRGALPAKPTTSRHQAVARESVCYRGRRGAGKPCRKSRWRETSWIAASVLPATCAEPAVTDT